jgi:hypothetical protein
MSKSDWRSSYRGITKNIRPMMSWLDNPIQYSCNRPFVASLLQVQDVPFLMISGLLTFLV